MQPRRVLVLLSICVLSVLAGVLSSGRPALAAGNNISRLDPVASLLNGEWSSLELDAQGFPVVSYIDATVASSLDLKLLHCGDATCSSGNSIQVVDGDVGPVGRSTSLELDDDGDPVISYYDSVGLNLKTVHCNDEDCAPGGNDFSFPDIGGDVGQWSSLELDSLGRPVISYYDATNTALKVAHCGDAYCNGGNSIQSPDTGGANDVGAYTSLKLDSLGRPVVSYRDTTNADLKILHCNDPNCNPAVNGAESTQTADGAGITVGQYTSLELDALGYPVVSHYSGSGDNLKVVHCNDANCAGGNESIQSLDTGGDVGRWTSLELDAFGRPVVSYEDTTNAYLKVAHCWDANCTLATISAPDTGPDFGAAGGATSLELDALGRPVVSYKSGSSFVGDTSYLTVLRCSDPDCAGQKPKPGLWPNIALFLDGNGDGSDNCDTDFGTGLGTKCNAALGSKLTVEVRLLSLGGLALGGYSAIQTRLGFAGAVSFQNRPGKGEAPLGTPCNPIIPIGTEDKTELPVSYLIGCSGLVITPSFFTGTVFEVDVTCDSVGTGTVALGHGVPGLPPGVPLDSHLVDNLVLSQHVDLNDAGVDEVLTVNCVVPPAADQQINITVRDELKGDPIGPGSCWLILAQHEIDPGVFVNKPVDIVSDNNANLGCDALGPFKANLSDKDPANGSIRITIDTALQLKYGREWHVQQGSPPPGFKATDFTKHVCDLSLGKCELTFVNDFQGKPNIDGDWNVQIGDPATDNCFFTVTQIKQDPDPDPANDPIKMNGSCDSRGALSLSGSVGEGTLSASGVYNSCTDFTITLTGDVSYNGDRISGFLACPPGSSAILTGTRKGDKDGDGCWDVRELQTEPGSQMTGGLRDPKSPWDYYDVAGPSGGPPDRNVDLFNDILGVIDHWLGGPPSYDPNFDRGPVAGPYPWNMTAPDGVIDLFNDILGVINQWNHDCR